MSEGCNCPPARGSPGPCTGQAFHGLTRLCKPHLTAPPPHQPSETRSPDYSLRIQKSLTAGAEQLRGVSHCAGQQRAVPGASPPGSSQGKRAVCGSHGKPPCLRRE